MVKLTRLGGTGFQLRHFTKDDAPALAAIEFDPEVKRFSAPPARGRDEWTRSFDPDTSGAWAVVVNGELAGRVELIRKGRGRGELAIFLARPYWGRGLGRRVATVAIAAAFDDLGANELLATVHPENKASIDLLEHFRFACVGCVGAADGEPEWQVGHLCYSLPRQDYFAPSGQVSP